MSKLKVSATWAWSMFVIGAFFYGFEFLLRVSPSVMVPYLMETYNINAKQVGILSAYYYYTYTPLQLIAGTMVDHYGTRILLVISLISCIIGIYFFGMTESLAIAKFGRALIGLGSAFAFVCTLRICSDWLPENMFATLAGITTTLGMVGAITGEILLEDLKELIGVKQTFLVYMIVGITLTILTWLIVRNKNLFSTKKNKVDEIKAIFKHMLFLMKKPIFWNISLIGLFLFMPTTIFASLWSVKFLGDVYYLKAPANYSSMIFIGWAIGGPLVGLIRKNFAKSTKKLLIAGSLLAAMSAIALIYYPDFSNDKLKLLLFSFGFFSSAEILVFDLNHIIAGPALCGTSVALTNMVIMIGGFFQPVVGMILDNGYKIGPEQYSPEQYKIALAILPISFIIGCIMSIIFDEKKVKPPMEIPE